jgi:site-specific recombinase XerD
VAKVVKSPRILLRSTEKIAKINSETLKIYSKYKIDMTIRELSGGTIDGYEGDLYSWFIFVSENQSNKNLTEIDEDDITEFVYYCKTGGNNSRRMKRRIASLSAFYKFLRKKKIVKENPLEFIESPKRDNDVVIQTFLTENQVQIMKNKLKENGNLQIEVYALLSLSTMARVNAVCNIAWKQIDFETRTINDVLEKESKIVSLFFNSEVRDLLLNLQKYRSLNSIDDKGWVFCTFYRQQYSKARKGTLQDWSKRIGIMINIPSLHAHDFRHSMAQILKLKGMPIEVISELLNHINIDTTRRFYLRQDKGKMIQEKDKYEM